MSEAAAHESPVFTKNHRAFLWRKLHSLSGVVPVGGFVVFHLFENARALQGQQQFDEAVSGINHLPYLPLLEWGAILLPLAFHAIFGVWIALHGKPNAGRYTYSRNWMYVLQRVSGFIALAFIGYHLWEYWGHKIAGLMTPEQFYPALCENMSRTTGGVPIVGIIYMIGIAAVALHLANGLWGFCFSWGITVSRRSQRISAWVFLVLGVGIFLLGANTTLLFARGTTAFSSQSCPPSAPH